MHWLGMEDSVRSGRLLWRRHPAAREQPPLRRNSTGKSCSLLVIRVAIGAGAAAAVARLQGVVGHHRPRPLPVLAQGVLCKAQRGVVPGSCQTAACTCPLASPRGIAAAPAYTTGPHQYLPKHAGSSRYAAVQIHECGRATWTLLPVPYLHHHGLIGALSVKMHLTWMVLLLVLAMRCPRTSSWESCPAPACHQYPLTMCMQDLNLHLTCHETPSAVLRSVQMHAGEVHKSTLQTLHGCREGM